MHWPTRTMESWTVAAAVQARDQRDAITYQPSPPRGWWEVLHAVKQSTRRCVRHRRRLMRPSPRCMPRPTTGRSREGIASRLGPVASTRRPQPPRLARIRLQRAHSAAPRSRPVSGSCVGILSHPEQSGSFSYVLTSHDEWMGPPGWSSRRPSTQAPGVPRRNDCPWFRGRVAPWPPVGRADMHASRVGHAR